MKRKVEQNKNQIGNGKPIKGQLLTITVKEAAVLLGICENTMRTLVHRKDFPKIIVGRRIIIPREAFMKYINEVSINF